MIGSDPELLDRTDSRIEAPTRPAHPARPVTDAVLSDRELLKRRFALAHRALTLSRFAGTAAPSSEHQAVCLDLQACEAECRSRGLIRS